MHTQRGRIVARPAGGVSRRQVLTAAAVGLTAPAWPSVRWAVWTTTSAR